jgi:hypothetical protein
MAFLRRKAGLESAAFAEHWLNRHLPACGVDRLERLDFYGYRQNHGIRTSQTADLYSSDYDGFTELYFESLEYWHARFPPPRIEIAEADEARFLAGQPLYFATDDRVLVDGAVVDGCVKVVRLLRRRHDLRVREFRALWSEEHGPRVASTTPGLARYVHAEVVDSAYRDGQPVWDGFEILWLDDLDTARPALLEQRHDAFAEDDRAPTMVVHERVPECVSELVAAADRAAGFRVR